MKNQTGIHESRKTSNSKASLVSFDLEKVVDDIDLDMSELFNELKSVNAEAEWRSSMTDFQVKAQTIRRIFDRFSKSDLSTRRYLRHHLDEEWQSLNSSFDSLRDQFTDDELSQKSNQK